jgi:hypothetical protein
MYNGLAQQQWWSRCPLESVLGGYEFLLVVLVEYPSCPLVITMMIIATI